MLDAVASTILQNIDVFVYPFFFFGCLLPLTYLIKAKVKDIFSWTSLLNK